MKLLWPFTVGVFWFNVGALAYSIAAGSYWIPANVLLVVFCYFLVRRLWRQRSQERWVADVHRRADLMMQTSARQMHAYPGPIEPHRDDL